MGSLIQRDELLSTLAHELRNPLAPLRSGIELLLAGGDRPESDVLLLKMMERQVAQLVRVTDDVLDQRQTDKDDMRLLPRVFDLNEMVQSAIEQVRQRLGWERYDLRLVMPDRPVLLHADMERLAQALGNVLDNAVKFTPPGGIIELQAIERDAHVVITVRDQGIGLEPSRINRQLGMTQRMVPLHPPPHGGLGRGLRQAKRIVRSHGGVMHVECRGADTGSTFSIILPISLRSDNRSIS